MAEGSRARRKAAQRLGDWWAHLESRRTARIGRGVRGRRGSNVPAATRCHGPRLRPHALTPYAKTPSAGAGDRKSSTPADGGLLLGREDLGAAEGALGVEAFEEQFDGGREQVHD